MGNKNLRVSIAVLVATGLAMPLAGLAAAPSRLDDVGVRVSYAGLNIHNEAGAKVLYSRLRRASEDVCGLGSHLQLASLAAITKAKVCYKETLSAAVEKIDSDALRVIHKG